MVTKGENECRGGTWAAAQTRSVCWQGGRASCQVWSPKPPTPAQAPHNVSGCSGAGGAGSLLRAPGLSPSARVRPSGPAYTPASFRPTWSSSQPPALLHTVSLKQSMFLLLPRATSYVKTLLSPHLGAARCPPRDRDTDPMPQGSARKPKSPPNPPRLMSQNPRAARKSNHPPQIRWCLGAEPRPESPSLLSPDARTPSSPTAAGTHQGPPLIPSPQTDTVTCGSGAPGQPRGSSPRPPCPPGGPAQGIRQAQDHPPLTRPAAQRPAEGRPWISSI